MKTKIELDIPQNTFDNATKELIKKLKRERTSFEKKVGTRDDTIRELQKKIKDMEKELRAIDKCRNLVYSIYSIGKDVYEKDEEYY